MTRAPLIARPGALFIVLLLVALIALLPLRLALGWFGLAEQGLTARAVRGSLWTGTIEGARFGDIALGDLSARVAPLPLIVGQARIALEGAGEDGAARFGGTIGVSRHAIALDGMTATLPVGNAFAPVPVTTLALDGVRLRFADDRCDRASGGVRALLTGDVAGQAIPASMRGTPRCDGAALLLPLASAGGDAALLRIWPDGRYRAELTLAAGDPAAAARLQASGFAETPRGMQLAIDGRF